MHHHVSLTPVLLNQIAQTAFKIDILASSLLTLLSGKSLARLSLSSVRNPDSPSLRPTQTNETLNSIYTGTPKTSVSMDRTHSHDASQSGASNPALVLQPERTLSSDYHHHTSRQNPMTIVDGQSWAFWTRRDKSHLTAPSTDTSRPNLGARPSEMSQLSKLTDEMSDHEQDAVSGDDRSKVHCTQCGSEEFKIKFTSGEKVLVCVKCGKIVDDGADESGMPKRSDRNAYSRFYA